MKNILYLFLFCALCLTCVACASKESSRMGEARDIQKKIMEQKVKLDSLIDSSVEEFNKTISTMSQNEAMMTDSGFMKEFSGVQSRVSSLATWKSKLSDFSSAMPMIPEGELPTGSENPFGESATDEDILNAMNENFNTMNGFKASIDSISKN